MANNSIADLFIKEAVKTESCNFVEIAERLSQPRTIRLLHSAMGLSTEANEFLDALKKWIFYGKELDTINLGEEIGDNFWYAAIACDELGKSFEEIQIAVIQKLRKRYADKFSSADAINRNLSAEREILESNLHELTENVVEAVKMEIVDNEEVSIHTKRLAEITKEELQKEEYDMRQNESALEYGTRIYKQLEKRLKEENDRTSGKT